MPSITDRSPRRACITGLGHGPARQGRSPTTTSQPMFDTTDEWIVERTGIHERRVGGTTVGPRHRVRPQRPRDVPASTRRRSTSSCSPPPRPTEPCPPRRPPCSDELGLRCGAFDINAACSGFVYALVDGRTASSRLGAQRVLVHRRRHACRGSPTGTTATRPSCSPTAPAPCVLEACDGPGQLLGWDLDADGAAERFLYADIGGYHPDGGQGGVPPGRADHGRLRREVADARRRDRRRDRAGRPPPGQHPHHRGRLRAPRHRRWSGRPPCCTTPATRRRRRSRWPSSTPLDDGRVNDGDLVLLVGFGAGMTAAPRRRALGWRRAVTPRYGARHRRRPGHRPRLRPALRRARATRSPSPTTRRRRPTSCSASRATSPSGREVDAAFTQVEEQFGPVEVLVSNAGITQDGLLLRMSEDDFTVGDRHQPHRRVPGRQARRAGHAAGPRGPHHPRVLGRRAARLGRARRTTPRRRPASSGFARSLARELGSRSITVNVVAPGPVATDMTAALGEKRIAELTAAVPLGRFGTPDEIAGVVAFLASDRRRVHHRRRHPRRRRPGHGPLTRIDPSHQRLAPRQIEHTTRRDSWIRNCSTASRSAPSRCSPSTSRPVEPEAKFGDDLDADSLDLVELVMALEEEFGVEVPRRTSKASRPSARPTTWSSASSEYDAKRPLMGCEAAEAGASPSPAIGVVAPCGIGKDAFWNGLLGPGLTDRKVTTCRRLGPVAVVRQPQGGSRRADRVEQFAIAAAAEAFEQAGDVGVDPSASASIFGTGVGGLQHARGPDQRPPREGRPPGVAVPRADDDGQRLGRRRCSMRYGLAGPVRDHRSPRARRRHHAIGNAARLIAWGSLRRDGHRRVRGARHPDRRSPASPT